ncbi:unnamed protein product [Symbiodinium sp. CCMP2592]|nr:unnamed protein product [Symbiodinium sp. CCMP2592]
MATTTGLAEVEAFLEDGAPTPQRGEASAPAVADPGLGFSQDLAIAVGAGRSVGQVYITDAGQIYVNRPRGKGTIYEPQDQDETLNNYDKVTFTENGDHIQRMQRVSWASASAVRDETAQTAAQGLKEAIQALDDDLPRVEEVANHQVYLVSQSEARFDNLITFARGVIELCEQHGAVIIQDFEGEQIGYGGEILMAQLKPSFVLDASCNARKLNFNTPDTRLPVLILDLRCLPCVQLLRDLQRNDRIMKISWGSERDFHGLMYQREPLPILAELHNVLDAQLAFSISSRYLVGLKAVPGLLPVGEHTEQARPPAFQAPQEPIDFTNCYKTNVRAFGAPAVFGLESLRYGALDVLVTEAALSHLEPIYTLEYAKELTARLLRTVTQDEVGLQVLQKDLLDTKKLTGSNLQQQQQLPQDCPRLRDKAYRALRHLRSIRNKIKAAEWGKLHAQVAERLSTSWLRDGLPGVSRDDVRRLIDAPGSGFGSEAWTEQNKRSTYDEALRKILELATQIKAEAARGQPVFGNASAETSMPASEDMRKLVGQLEHIVEVSWHLHAQLHQNGVLEIFRYDHGTSDTGSQAPDTDRFFSIPELDTTTDRRKYWQLHKSGEQKLQWSTQWSASTLVRQQDQQQDKQVQALLEATVLVHHDWHPCHGQCRFVFNMPPGHQPPTGYAGKYVRRHQSFDWLQEDRTLPAQALQTMAWQGGCRDGERVVVNVTLQFPRCSGMSTQTQTFWWNDRSILAADLQKWKADVAGQYHEYVLYWRDSQGYLCPLEEYPRGFKQFADGEIQVELILQSLGILHDKCLTKVQSITGHTVTFGDLEKYFEDVVRKQQLRRGLAACYQSASGRLRKLDGSPERLQAFSRDALKQSSSSNSSFLNFFFELRQDRTRLTLHDVPGEQGPQTVYVSSEELTMSFILRQLPASCKAIFLDGKRHVELDDRSLPAFKQVSLQNSRSDLDINFNVYVCEAIMSPSHGPVQTLAAETEPAGDTTEAF